MPDFKVAESATPAAPDPVHSDQASRRRWRSRLIAVTVGFAPFVILEIVFRLFGVGDATRVTDPFVGFASVRPLFERDESGERYVTSPARQPFFKPDGFAARKGAREFRIFCLGGSTVQGNPYSIETSFTTWLELSLQAADPRREFQVVNCGGISYASYRLAPILEECLRYEPDLFILCLGHNEFLEDRSYAHVRRLPKWLARVHFWASHLRLFRVAHEWWTAVASSPDQAAVEQRFSEEVDALLDYRGGLAHYHRDDAWRQGVLEHFHASLNRMVQSANAAGVPLILVDPPCNLKDCPPFKVEADPTLTGEQRKQIENLMREAGQDDTRLDVRIAQLRAILDLDPEHAGAWYLLAQSHGSLGDASSAHAAFLRAKDADVCPLRILESQREVLRQVADSHQVPLVPAMRMFAEQSPDGIPGEELLLDHVHPTISGHQMMARALLEVMESRGFVETQAGWQTRREAAYRAHFSTLDTPYFARGQEHLEGLRKWTQGRANKLRGGAPPR